MVITIANQKGGVQKSTLTSVFATAIHYGFTKYKTAIIDIDLQQSLYVSRQKELEYINNNPAEQKKLDEYTKKRGIDLYPIYKCGHTEVKGKVKELEDEGYTFIFLDVPGTLEAEGLDLVYPLVDFIFIPCYTDSKTQHSTMQFVKKINYLLKGNKIENNLIDYAVFFTKYTKNPKLKDFDKFFTIRESLKAVDINILDNGFLDSKVFSDHFPWTVFPLINDKRMSQITPIPLFVEMIQFMNSKSKK